MVKNIQWWSEEYGFFGNHYLEGDDSQEGYLIAKKQTLAERTATEVEGIIRTLGLKGGEKVLDIPCGYGRHSIGLAKRGFMITGSDLNRTHLDKAKQEARLAGVDINFIQEDMFNPAGNPRL